MKTWSFNAKFRAILVFAYAAASCVERGAFSARHTAIPELSSLVQRLVLVCLIAYWISADSRATRTSRVWDMGFFLCLAWPAIVPYYLVKTRGRKRAFFTFLVIVIGCVGAFAAGKSLFRWLQ